MRFREFFERTSFKLIIYGMFSNWGLVVLSNIIGLLFISVIGIDLVRKFTPFVYAILSLILYFPMPRSHDFKIGYMMGFVIGLGLLFKFYYAFSG